ncbi:uveal autoantigen with coiled-coil domains and ankyrin repeats protein-like isoform X1 [Rhopalosiphum padi]|uniref:uveal autoantigen with coiled-coil domains and ankyrin repeats protein-like isoform X1 n=1 Tax=Rhopalosiphum padi TaxID=40932 RepID=UPI00298E208D|nr:uveal autoantigen with coiled-coil domains and ankyrin repeats protein-like isoform X1 [Rhopalosiphum padi]XP_060838607.1 uveal autoantigen with coiled-coil domains and ankyrin repeats protein-like isoform X1 [Rhopalosiphum padi]
MESKSCRQKNAMISLSKPKYKTSLPEKQNTWGNLLNKKSVGTNTAISTKNKTKKYSSIPEMNTKSMTKSVQCNDSPIDNECKSFTSLSVFNPIRTLQFLLKEIKEFPSVQNGDIAKIVNEMQIVVGRIVDECAENSSSSKLNNNLAINYNSMIPTRDNDYCKNLKYDNSSQENKYLSVLLAKISELENHYSQQTKDNTKSKEKLQSVTSERDRLLEKFKESCNLLEKLNNREREYLDTITALKSKLVISEKLIRDQDIIITDLNKRLNNLPNKNKTQEYENENIPTEQHNTYKTVLKENNKFNKITKSHLDKLAITSTFKDNEVSKLRSDIKQMKQIVLTGLENNNIKSVSMTSLKSEDNLINDFPKHIEDNKKYEDNDIDTQYTEYNREASAIKLAKTELHQLFETIKTQAYHSKKLFNSTFVDNEKVLSDISDEEESSNVSNFMSVVTHSSC